MRHRLVVIARAATISALGLTSAAMTCADRTPAPPTATRAAPAAPAASAIPAGFPPPTRTDPADRAASPLDLRQVTFGQRGTRLELELRTTGDWTANQLSQGALCIDLRRGRHAGRVCVTAVQRRLALEYRPMAGTAPVGRPRAVPALIRREDRRSLFTRFQARAVALPNGPFQWSVTSRSGRGGACAVACTDRVPDHGAYAAIVSPLAQARCFGAAARAAARACRNPALRRAVVPRPSDAVWSPGSPCDPVDDPLRSDVLRPCEFGDRHTSRQPALALIGDSHTDHWRAAVDVAAQARGWRAVNMTRPGCSFSNETYPAPAPIPANCHRHSYQAIRWLRAHPSVHTVVTSSSAGRGLTAAGYRTIWRRVPPSVKRIYVLRDVPRMRVSTGDCVSAVRRRQMPSAGTCSVARRWALVDDTSARAAASGPARVRLLDFTRVFCDRSRCFPVVGGAYVYKDDNHMNTTFARTLGPVLLRQMR